MNNTFSACNKSSKISFMSYSKAVYISNGINLLPCLFKLLLTLSTQPCKHRYTWTSHGINKVWVNWELEETECFRGNIGTVVLCIKLSILIKYEN